MNFHSVVCQKAWHTPPKCYEIHTFTRQEPFAKYALRSTPALVIITTQLCKPPLLCYSSKGSVYNIINEYSHISECPAQLRTKQNLKVVG